MLYEQRMTRSKLDQLYELKTLRKTSENYRRARENRRDVTQAQEEQAWKPPRCCMQQIPSIYDAALQNQQAKAC